MDGPASLDQLPPEIADLICTYLEQSETSRLLLSAKPIYRLIRPILYRHPRVNSFVSLTLFNRTFTRAKDDCINQTISMCLTLDCVANTHQPATAILISKNLLSIERYASFFWSVIVRDQVCTQSRAGRILYTDHWSLST